MSVVEPRFSCNYTPVKNYDLAFPSIEYKYLIASIFTHFSVSDLNEYFDQQYFFDEKKSKKATFPHLKQIIDDSVMGLSKMGTGTLICDWNSKLKLVLTPVLHFHAFLALNMSLWGLSLLCNTG